MVKDKEESRNNDSVIFVSDDKSIAVVRNKEGDLGLINFETKEQIVPFGVYDEYITDGYSTYNDIVVRLGDLYGVINGNGKILVPVSYESKDLFLLLVDDKSLYRVRNDEKNWGVYDSESQQEIFPCICTELFLMKTECLSSDKFDSVVDIEYYFDVRAKYEAAIAKARVNHAEKDEEVEKYLEEYRALMAELIEAKTKLVVERQKELEAIRKLKDAKDGAIGVIDSILNNFNEVDGGLNV